MTGLGRRPLTVIAEQASTVNAVWDEGRPIVAPELLGELLGWEWREEGLCRETVCVPVSDRSQVEHDEGIDILAVAEILDRPAVIDADAGLLVVGQPAGDRLEALHGRRAPDFTLPDLTGSLHSFSDWVGHKRLLVAFASW
ncbi:MAG: hypothetical protein VYA26_08225 [Actinomycetota bacterium]|nr:hypothetical protein [Actinomycetota bacterium]MED6329850.1 hypothetical protein [Actinomycetota bacterium]